MKKKERKKERKKDWFARVSNLAKFVGNFFNILVIYQIIEIFINNTYI